MTLCAKGCLEYTILHGVSLSYNILLSNMWSKWHRINYNQPSKSLRIKNFKNNEYNINELYKTSKILAD